MRHADWLKFKWLDWRTVALWGSVSVWFFLLLLFMFYVLGRVTQNSQGPFHLFFPLKMQEEKVCSRSKTQMSECREESSSSLTEKQISKGLYLPNYSHLPGCAPPLQTISECIWMKLLYRWWDVNIYLHSSPHGRHIWTIGTIYTFFPCILCLT